MGTSTFFLVFLFLNNKKIRNVDEGDFKLRYWNDFFFFLEEKMK